jgi:hypothetical protein
MRENRLSSCTRNASRLQLRSASRVGRLEILKDSPPISAKAKVRRIRNAGAEIVRKWRRAQRVANFGNIYKQEFLMPVVISNRIYGPSRS